MVRSLTFEQVFYLGMTLTAEARKRSCIIPGFILNKNKFSLTWVFRQVVLIY